MNKVMLSVVGGPLSVVSCLPMKKPTAARGSDEEQCRRGLEEVPEAISSDPMIPCDSKSLYTTQL